MQLLKPRKDNTCVTSQVSYMSYSDMSYHYFFFVDACPRVRGSTMSRSDRPKIKSSTEWLRADNMSSCFTQWLQTNKSGGSLELKR